MEDLHRGQTAVSCQMCEKSSQIKWKCINCDYLLCTNCYQLHRKVKSLDEHQIVDIKDIASHGKESVIKRNFKNIECTNHLGQLCCLFCQECDQVTCPVCVSTDHNQHKMIQISEGYKIVSKKINLLQNSLEKEIKNLEADISSLDSIHVAENSKYHTEMQKIQSHDKALKDVVDAYTKQLVDDLDHRWNKLNRFIQEERTEERKNEELLQSRNESMNKAIESNNAGEVFKTVEQEKLSKKQETKSVKLTYETLPNFVPGKITQSIIKSMLGSFHDSINFDIKLNDNFRTDFPSISNLKCCPLSDSMWINCYTEEILVNMKIGDNGSLKTLHTIKFSVGNIAISRQGDLLISAEASQLLVIPYKEKSMKRSQFSVSPLVTTFALHVAFDKVIVGAKEKGPIYPVQGTRQVIVMDQSGRHEKVYEFNNRKKPLFTNPRRITTDSNNNLYVLDRTCGGWSGRVMIITGKGETVYTGHPAVNKTDHPFTPGDLEVTKSDNIIVTDTQNHTLHILDSDGKCLQYINTKDIGIKWPWSLSIDKEGVLFIGCNKTQGIIRLASMATGIASGAKIYAVKLS